MLHGTHTNHYCSTNLLPALVMLHVVCFEFFVMNTVEYSTVQYNTEHTVQYSAVQYNTEHTIQYSAVQYSRVHVLLKYLLTDHLNIKLKFF